MTSTTNPGSHQTISNIPTSSVSMTSQTKTTADSLASQSASNSYGYYVDPNLYNSQYYQQYYQQYYAYAATQSGMPSNYNQQQQFGAIYYPSIASCTIPATYNSTYLTTQASYLPSVLTTTTSDQTNNSENGNLDEYDDDDDDDPTIAKPNKPKLSNVLTYHCNEKMGLNPLIYTNIQQSPYFKNNLFQLKTYNEVIDEIYYSVKHLEPWEKGSRKVSGQSGMCGSVRGVGAGGIISTPFCILYKLFTLRLTRKQVLAMIRHKDSSYIRALGFMYIRFTQPSQDLWQWFEPYLDDEEKVDPKAGGGSPMTIGQMARHFLTKLEWFSTLFPRIPRHVQLEIEKKLEKYDKEYEEESRNSKSSNYKNRKRHDHQDQDEELINDEIKSVRKYRSHYNDYHSKGINGRDKRSRSRSISPASSKHRSKKYDDHNRKNSSRYS